MTLNGNSQIVDLYETSGLSPEDIASSIGYDMLAVKAILSQFSHKYREATKEVVSEDWSADEQKEARDILLSLARNSEDDHLRAKCAVAIVKDKREGQKVKSLFSSGPQLNITLVQQQIEAGRSALKPVEVSGSIQIPAKEAKMLEEARRKAGT